jgi:TonB family protein
MFPKLHEPGRVTETRLAATSLKLVGLLIFSMLVGVHLGVGFADVGTKAGRSANPLSGIESSGFRAVEAERVTEVARPFRNTEYGTVVLEVHVSEFGKVTNIEVRHGITSLNQAAIRAVQSWRFHPAEFDRKTVTSSIVVAVTFNPLGPTKADESRFERSYRGVDSELEPTFVPPEVSRAVYPMSPPNISFPADIALQVTVDSTGRTQTVSVLRDVPPFTDRSIQAARNWQFIPAQLDGAAVTSKVILVFVFSPSSKTH